MVTLQLCSENGLCCCKDWICIVRRVVLLVITAPVFCAGTVDTVLPGRAASTDNEFSLFVSALPHKIVTIHFPVHPSRSFRNPLDDFSLTNTPWKWLPPFSWLFVYFRNLSCSINHQILRRSARQSVIDQLPFCLLINSSWQIVTLSCVLRTQTAYVRSQRLNIRYMKIVPIFKEWFKHQIVEKW